MALIWCEPLAWFIHLTGTASTFVFLLRCCATDQVYNKHAKHMPLNILQEGDSLSTFCRRTGLSNSFWSRHFLIVLLWLPFWENNLLVILNGLRSSFTEYESNTSHFNKKLVYICGQYVLEVYNTGQKYVYRYAQQVLRNTKKYVIIYIHENKWKMSIHILQIWVNKRR